MRVLLPWAAAMLLAAPALRAQNACSESLTWPAVGAWAEYKGTYDTDNAVTTRYAVVGVEQREGTDYKWVELKMHDAKKNQDMIYQMLVPGGPLEVAKVQEVVMKMGTDPAMKMGGMMVGVMRSQLAKTSALEDACKEVTLVGDEKVTVPAGAFTAKHFHSAKNESDSWVDASIPFSLVKSVGKSHEMELVAMGTGATSSITETPQEMSGM